jgi:hypothetical protein
MKLTSFRWQPRLFCGWFPADPTMPVYVWFELSPNRSPKWAISALGKPWDGEDGNSFASMTDMMTKCEAWTPEIAADMIAANNGPPSQLKQRRKAVLQKHYDALPVIQNRDEDDMKDKNPSRSKLEGQKAPEKRKKAAEEEDEEKTPVVLGGYKARLEAKWREREKVRLANLGALDPNTAIANVKNDITDDGGKGDDGKQDGEISDGCKSPDKKSDGTKEDGTKEDSTKEDSTKEDDTKEDDSDEEKPRQRTVFSWGSLGTPLSLNRGKKLQSSWVLCMPNKLQTLLGVR